MAFGNKALGQKLRHRADAAVRARWIFVADETNLHRASNKAGNRECARAVNNFSNPTVTATGSDRAFARKCFQRRNADERERSSRSSAVRSCGSPPMPIPAVQQLQSAIDRYGLAKSDCAQCREIRQRPPFSGKRQHMVAKNFQAELYLQARICMGLPAS